MTVRPLGDNLKPRCSCTLLSCAPNDEDGHDRVRFNFCSVCGSTVFYTIDGMSEVTAIAVGAFTDPQFPAPTYSVYETRKHAWLSLNSAEMEHID